MPKGGVGKPFRAALARPVLNRLATIPVFQQGQELFLHHRLTGLAIDAEEAAAHVPDGETYLARLWMEDGFLQYECPCERGAEGFLCRHGVAVALAALQGVAAPGKAPAKSKSKKIDLAETDKVLREQSSDTLAGLLLNWAKQDDRLLQQLMSFAAQQGGFALDVKAYRASLKKRLKRPPLSARLSEFKIHAKNVELEINQSAALIDQGQPFAALEVTSDILKYLLAFRTHDYAREHWLTGLVPKALRTFVQAARLARAEPKVLIPHLLQFYQSNLQDQLQLRADSQAAFAELWGLLGPAGHLELARAAEPFISPAKATWEGRAACMRMLILAHRIYLGTGDFDGMERTHALFSGDDFRDGLGFARELMTKRQPERIVSFLTRLEQANLKPPPQDYYWLLAEAHLQTNRTEAAFAALSRVLELHQPWDIRRVETLASQYKCWPLFREYLLADRPPGNPAAPHRHHWRFQLHMLEANYQAAWPIAVWHPMDPALAVACAFEMRQEDPVHAARILTDNSDALMSHDRTTELGVSSLDAACHLVIDHHVRPENLLHLLRGTIKMFKYYGSPYLNPPRLPLWNRAIEILSAPLPASAPGRAGKAT